ncbi:UDP-N-acetylmuramyl-tripeptide synthetase [Candidatus Gottesmanbacteria bacterium]|nr:UDP-N-acetylmuramyl-tripeptide synthetase [Candidatus Gottesmanbacteria bacterium]
MEHIKALYHYIVAVIAVLVYGYPAKDLTVIAVTGTSGKTTTSHLIYSILKKSGRKAALISSVEAIIGGKVSDTGFHVTTPSPFALQKFLKTAVSKGDKYVVVEASSHGIAQYRMLGTNVKIAVLTNIAHEHLDWHGTFEAYSQAKLSLIQKAQVSVVNKDDESYKLVEKLGNKKAVILTYSLKDPDADFIPENTVSEVTLPGEYNRQNAIAASSVCQLLGVELEDIKKAFNSFNGVQGRFEEIKNKRGFRIIIDFAHKPNAFEALLSTLKKNADVSVGTPTQRRRGRLIIMFGSAGERDKGKRSMMGKIAAKYADICVLTAEDPRSEDVNRIINEISQGTKGSEAQVIRIADRALAINTVINKLAKKGDIVAFLGKGHEKSMCFGSKEYPWSEHEQINKALAKR